jgi:hypothetical protein
MCKGRHGGPGETRTIAHQEVAHDKATSYKRHAHRQSPLIKVDGHNIHLFNNAQ